jgi:hypothetical protein
MLYESNEGVCLKRQAFSFFLVAIWKKRLIVRSFFGHTNRVLNHSGRGIFFRARLVSLQMEIAQLNYPE